MEEWRKSPENPRNTPKLTDERAKQLADEAIAHGNKWDPQEKINARRQAERAAACGGLLGKISAPAKFDAAIPNPRCQAGKGAFGTYFVHPSQKYGIKLFRDVESDVDTEFDLLGKAHAAGVNTPQPLHVNSVGEYDDEPRARTMVLSHMKGYREAVDVYSRQSAALEKAPLIVRLKAAREFRKLHAEGIAHGDIHGGNIMVNERSKRVAIIDFGYATALEATPHPQHYRDGVQNMKSDLERLPRFLGMDGVQAGVFLERNKGVIANIEKQGRDYSDNYKSAALDRFDLGVKRYHDALERELLVDDGRTRSRFVSGADQPRIPGLTRRILTANVPSGMRTAMERDLAFGTPAAWGKDAKLLGVKPARLFLAFKPEREARIARQQRNIFGTPIQPAAPRPVQGTTTRRLQRGFSFGEDLTQKFNSVGVLRWLPRSAPASSGLSTTELARRIKARTGNENMSNAAALRQARSEQRVSSWKD